MRRLPLPILVLTLGCDPGAITNSPLLRGFVSDLAESIGEDGVSKLTEKLRDAVPDLDVSGMPSAEGCAMYIAEGKDLAEAVWTQDWPVFAPMLKTPVDAEADQAFCRDVITSRGAKILSKPKGLRHSTAIVFAVLLDPDFEDKSERRQAATMCHEAAHIVWQKRVGIKRASAQYISVSGRLVPEMTAYALGDLVLRRNGVTPEWITAARQSRSERFPETYKLTRTISSECVEGYQDAVSQELEKRVGQ